MDGRRNPTGAPRNAEPHRNRRRIPFFRVLRHQFRIIPSFSRCSFHVSPSSSFYQYPTIRCFGAYRVGRWEGQGKRGAKWTACETQCWLGIGRGKGRQSGKRASRKQGDNSELRKKGDKSELMTRYHQNGAQVCVIRWFRSHPSTNIQCVVGLGLVGGE